MLNAILLNGKFDLLFPWGFGSAIGTQGCTLACQCVGLPIGWLTAFFQLYLTDICKAML
jgi:hypothetical protein